MRKYTCAPAQSWFVHQPIVITDESVTLNIPNKQRQQRHTLLRCSFIVRVQIGKWRNIVYWRSSHRYISILEKIQGYDKTNVTDDEDLCVCVRYPTELDGGLH
jgi:hypothetical protein